MFDGVLAVVVAPLVLLGCQTQQSGVRDETPQTFLVTDDSFRSIATDILQKEAPLADLPAIPASADIRDVKIEPDANYHSGHVPPLTAETFALLLDSATPIPADSELIFAWHYAPWCRVSFSTPGGRHRLELYLGGIGFLLLPSGEVGAIRFEHPK